eukprot:gnl/TRDRNA2_/TRDRNA2_128344_c0_seq1.p1 gnl/TRDRNA2_/TRDRNA2_128344_c0~~gnl/TRDRNA2_/TRDRNA2_128344_c0_seq1.p1  ORF type:complete len:278 (-),score=17.07 gnl/TRDRNA2_/TRDRNA2_128344_c0_seq1:169-939(-)
MSDDNGWQMRLCAAICAPPIHRLRFTHRTAISDKEIPLFDRGLKLLLILGIAHSYLNTVAYLNDFMSGGTDLFAAILGFCAQLDMCAMNGSFYVMFMIWSGTNATLFDIVFSLLPNLLYGLPVGGPMDDVHVVNGTVVHTNATNAHEAAASSAWWRPLAFAADNLILVLVSILQIWLVFRARNILDSVLPDWWNQAVHGTGGLPTSTAGAPLLGRPPPQQSGMRSVQPSSGSSFVAFGGSGQRLGGSGRAADPRRM